MSYTVPSKTLGDVFEYIKRQFGDESGVQITLSDCTRWVNAAEAEIISQNQVLRAVATSTTVANDEDYVLGDSMDIQTINSIQVSGVKIPFKNYNEAEDYISRNDPSKVQRSFPVFWYEWGGTIFFYPIPDSNYVMKVYYHKIPVTLTGSADKLNVPDNYFNRILEYCMAQAYELDEQFDAASVKGTQFEDRLLNMNLDETFVNIDVYPSLTVLADDL
jgi:hypothetical protein